MNKVCMPIYVVVVLVATVIGIVVPALAQPSNEANEWIVQIEELSERYESRNSDEPVSLAELAPANKLIKQLEKQTDQPWFPAAVYRLDDVYSFAGHSSQFEQWCKAMVLDPTNKLTGEHRYAIASDILFASEMSDNSGGGLKYYEMMREIGQTIKGWGMDLGKEEYSFIEDRMQLAMALRRFGDAEAERLRSLGLPELSVNAVHAAIMRETIDECKAYLIDLEFYAQANDDISDAIIRRRQRGAEGLLIFAEYGLAEDLKEMGDVEEAFAMFRSLIGRVENLLEEQTLEYELKLAQSNSPIPGAWPSGHLTLLWLKLAGALDVPFDQIVSQGKSYIGVSTPNWELNRFLYLSAFGLKSKESAYALYQRNALAYERAYEYWSILDGPERARIIERDPSFYLTYFQLAELAFELGDVQAAKSYLKKVREHPMHGSTDSVTRHADLMWNTLKTAPPQEDVVVEVETAAATLPQPTSVASVPSAAPVDQPKPLFSVPATSDSSFGAWSVIWWILGAGGLVVLIVWSSGNKTRRKVNAL